MFSAIRTSASSGSQKLTVPAGILGDFVVGERKRASLGLGQSPQLDHWDLLEPKEQRRRIAPVTGNDVALLVNQNGIDKAKGSDAVGNLPDLFARVRSRVAAVRLQLLDRDVSDFNHELSPLRPRSVRQTLRPASVQTL